MTVIAPLTAYFDPCQIHESVQGRATRYVLKTRVHPRAWGDRPYIELEKTAHPLSVDFRHGISVEKAQEIAETITHR